MGRWITDQGPNSDIDMATFFDKKTHISTEVVSDIIVGADKNCQT